MTAGPFPRLVEEDRQASEKAPEIKSRGGPRKGSFERWIVTTVAEGVLLGLGAYFSALALNAVQLVRLPPLTEVMIAVTIVLVVVSLRLIWDNRRMRTNKKTLDDNVARMDGENDRLRGQVRQLTEKLALQASVPMEFVLVERLAEVLDKPDKEIVVSRWWPQGLRVAVEITSSDNADVMVAFYRTEVTPAVLSKDHSAASVKWTQGRTRKWNKEFQTDAAGIWYFFATWPKGNAWGSDIVIRVWEQRPATMPGVIPGP